MAIDGTYTGLQTSIADWLHRSDMTTIIPDLIVLAEARIARDLRLRRQVSNVTLATIAATQAVALPSDYLELENISVIQGGVNRQLTYINIESLNAKYPDGSYSGCPQVYGFEADNLLFGPTPDAVYSLETYYYARFAALSVTPTNWLLTNHPNIYLFAALAEAGDYTRDKNNVPIWDGKYQRDVAHLQKADDAAMFSGAALRVRKI